MSWKIFIHSWLQEVILQYWCDHREYINMICYGNFLFMIILSAFEATNWTPKKTLFLPLRVFLRENNEPSNNHFISLCHNSYNLALKVTIFVYIGSFSTENLGKFRGNSRISLGKIWIFQDYSGEFSSNRVGNPARTWK